jgi:hypothetical protein
LNVVVGVQEDGRRTVRCRDLTEDRWVAVGRLEELDVFESGSFEELHDVVCGHAHVAAVKTRGTYRRDSDQIGEGRLEAREVGLDCLPEMAV